MWTRPDSLFRSRSWWMRLRNLWLNLREMSNQSHGITEGVFELVRDSWNLRAYNLFREFRRHSPDENDLRVWLSGTPRPGTSFSIEFRFSLCLSLALSLVDVCLGIGRIPKTLAFPPIHFFAVYTERRRHRGSCHRDGKIYERRLFSWERYLNSSFDHADCKIPHCVSEHLIKLQGYWKYRFDTCFLLRTVRASCPFVFETIHEIPP